MTGTASSPSTPGPAAAAAAADVVRLMVLSPSELGRSCIVAGLADGDQVEVRSCDNPATDRGPTPDIVLLQDVGAPHGGGWLSDQLRLAGSTWPEARLVVLAHEAETSLRLCLDAGVHACLPPQVELRQVMTAVRLLADGLIVYPARLLAMQQTSIGLRLGPAARGNGGIAYEG
jgi:DNA-binding NarL/FixJ family response regulator